ncbi:hypothetical protein C8Q76DRAFT_74355, partial [Earliella scabrosa]
MLPTALVMLWSPSRPSNVSRKLCNRSFLYQPCSSSEALHSSPPRSTKPSFSREKRGFNNKLLVTNLIKSWLVSFATGSPFLASSPMGHPPGRGGLRVLAHDVPVRRLLPLCDFVQNLNAHFRFIFQMSTRLSSNRSSTSSRHLLRVTYAFALRHPLRSPSSLSNTFTRNRRLEAQLPLERVLLRPSMGLYRSVREPC